MLTSFALVIALEINGQEWEAVPHVYSTLNECLSVEHEYNIKTDLVWSGCYAVEETDKGITFK